MLRLCITNAFDEFTIAYTLEEVNQYLYFYIILCFKNGNDSHLAYLDEEVIVIEQEFCFQTSLECVQVKE